MGWRRIVKTFWKKKVLSLFPTMFSTPLIKKMISESQLFWTSLNSCCLIKLKQGINRQQMFVFRIDNSSSINTTIPKQNKLTIKTQIYKSNIRHCVHKTFHSYPECFIRWQFFDLSNIKRFACNTSNVDKMGKVIWERVGNIVEKEKMLVTSIFSFPNNVLKHPQGLSYSIQNCVVWSLMVFRIVWYGV